MDLCPLVEGLASIAGQWMGRGIRGGFQDRGVFGRAGIYPPKTMAPQGNSERKRSRDKKRIIPLGHIAKELQ
jgi:hypothetical protein